MMIMMDRMPFQLNRSVSDPEIDGALENADTLEELEEASSDELDSEIVSWLG